MEEPRSPLDELARETAQRLRARSERYRYARESEVAGWLRGLLELTIETAHLAGDCPASDHPAQCALDAFLVACADRRFAAPDLAVIFEEAAATLERVAGTAGLPSREALKPALEQVERYSLAGFAARQEQLGAADERLFAALLESLPEALIVADANDRICQASERLRAIFGLGRLDLVGRGLHAILAEPLARQVSDPDGFAAAVVALYAAPEQEHAFELRLRDGRPFLLRSQPLDDDDRPLGRLVGLAELAERPAQREQAEQERASSSPRRRPSGPAASSAAASAGLVDGSDEELDL